MKKSLFIHIRRLCLLCLCLLVMPYALAETPEKKPTLEQLIQARQEWEVKSKQGDAEASAKLGALYLSGSLGSPDFTMARKYLEIGADVDLSARLAYGHLLMNGLGGKTDLNKAEQVFAKAAEKGSLEGLYLKSKLVLGRQASDSEVQTAVVNISNAADKGFPPALSTVGEFYRTGTFTKKNPELAIEYFLKAAKGGYAEGLTSAADMYLFSELGRANIAEAEKHYREAVSKGVKSASYSLAFLLYHKNPENKELLSEAFQIAKIAAFAWDERCQYLLGLMYFEGLATPADAEQAYFWLDLAASAGVFEAHHIRAISASSLTDKQVSRTKARAQEWFTANHNQPHKHLFIDNNVHRYSK
ncbi:MAG: sel1 repeat family protein [Oceanospirillales bacterium]|nr:sel1 repeat family protein [Oceanospirillales bacterium]MBR9889325.1 sel1 repeat family protein [Oceanospirillales bacterium]